MGIKISIQQAHDDNVHVEFSRTPETVGFDRNFQTGGHDSVHGSPDGKSGYMELYVINPICPLTVRNFQTASVLFFHRCSWNISVCCWQTEDSFDR